MGLAPLLEIEARNLTIGGLKRLEVARVMATRRASCCWTRSWPGSTRPTSATPSP